MLLCVPNTSRGPTTPVPLTPFATTSASLAGTNSENISCLPVADCSLRYSTKNGSRSDFQASRTSTPGPLIVSIQSVDWLPLWVKLVAGV